MILPTSFALRELRCSLTTACIWRRRSRKTTHQSDLWWVRLREFWLGIQFIQEENTIFATLFAYGPDGKPTWYSAILFHVGFLTWSGDLFATTGPWFGTVPFIPATVTRTNVGTMSFNAPFVNQGTLTYIVNGVAVTKQIQRQTLVTQSFSGVYTGTLSQQGTGLPPCDPARDPARDTACVPATFEVTSRRTVFVAIAAVDDTLTAGASAPVVVSGIAPKRR